MSTHDLVAVCVRFQRFVEAGALDRAAADAFIREDVFTPSRLKRVELKGTVLV
jgi:hypothetical protein